MIKYLKLITLLWMCSSSLSAQLLFEDNFNRSTIGNEWRIVDDVQPQSGPSNWFIEEEILKQSSNIWSYPDEARETKYHLGTHAVVQNTSWQDYSLNAIAFTSDDDGLGLIARYQDAQNYYRLLLMNDSNWAGVDEQGNRIGQPIQRLQKFVGGEPITLAENRVGNAYPDTWFSITLDVRQDSLIAYLNGEKILEATDEAYSNGGFGLLSYANSGLSYDSVRVNAEPEIYAEPNRAIRYNFQTIVERAPYIQRPNPTHVDIAWRTEQAGIGIIEYGTDKDVLDRSIQEEAAKQIHLLRLDGLQPDTRYWYKVYSNDQEILELASFKTPPTNYEDEVSFFLLGDSGVDTPTQYKVSEEMWKEYLRDPVDFMVHVGDVHQGDGDGYDAVYFRPYQKLLQHLNNYTAIGNHDTYTLNAQPYLESFYLPNNNPAQTERYYSFRWGKAFFICLDTNIDYLPGSAQYDFLLESLQSEERASATWTFVYAHHPPYSEFWVNYEGEPNVRDYLVPIFEEYQVDMVMNGHTHSYERGEKEHVHYLVSGGGGGGLDDYFIDHPHIVVSEKRHHFTRIDLREDRMRIRAIDENGNIFDTEEFQKRFTTFVNESDVKPQFKLNQNYPNPFNPSTTISFELQQSAEVRIDLVDSLGKVVRTLQASKAFSSGTHQISMSSNNLPSGTYIYRLYVNGRLEAARSMTFLK